MANKTNTKTKGAALVGNEKVVPYKVLPVAKDVSRFSHGAKVFSDNLGSMIFINLLMVIFVVPVFIWFLFKASVATTNGANGPFGDNLGIGYPAFPDLSGVAETITLNNDAIFFAVAIALSLVAAVGVAGGIYCVRKLLRSEERFRFVDFFIGVKKNYVPSAIACVLGFIAVYLTVLTLDLMLLAVSTSTAVGGFVVLFIVAVLASVALCLFALWFLAVATNYDLTVKATLLNSVSLLLRSIVLSVVFGVFSAVPALLSFIPVISSFVVPLYIMFGFAFALIVWLSFADWTFDAVAGYSEQVKVAQDEAERKESEKALADSDVMSLLLVEGKSEYLARPVQPIAEGDRVTILPERFTIEDVKALKKSREKAKASAKAYEAAHKGEKKYVEYNARFNEREKPVVEKNKKGKEKKYTPQMLS